MINKTILSVYEITILENLQVKPELNLLNPKVNILRLQQSTLDKKKYYFQKRSPPIYVIQKYILHK